MSYGLVDGFPILKIIRKLGVACILGGGIAVVIIAPSMFCDSAKVNDHGFSLRTGLWGMTAKHDFEYSQLANVRYVIEHSVDKKGKHRSTSSLICEHQSGKIQKVPLGNEKDLTGEPVDFHHLTIGVNTQENKRV